MSETGNAAVLREVLVEVKKRIGGMWEWCEIEDVVEAALAAPARNCDVGTVEEQTRRLRANCEKYKPSCKGCKFLTDIQHENCWLKWAQMPYAERVEEKANDASH